MELPLRSASNCEIRSVICFLTEEQVLTREIYIMLHTFRFFFVSTAKGRFRWENDSLQLRIVKVYARKCFAKLDASQYALDVCKLIRR